MICRFKISGILKYKRIFYVVFLLCLITIAFSFRLYSLAASAEEDEIWMGFVQYESGAEGGRSAGSDYSHAYGIAQFDDRYDLWGFVGRVLAEDEQKYAAFKELHNKYSNTKSLISANSADTAAMVSAWHSVYDADPEGFTKRQIEEFISKYYPPCVSGMSKQGIDISDTEKYSPVLRGTLLSISIWAGSSGVQKVIQKLKSSMSEEEMLNICYSPSTSELKGTKTKYLNGFRNRWEKGQRNSAIQDLAKWKNGESIATSSAGDLGSMLQGAGILYGIDGGSYTDYVKAFIDSHEELMTGFKESGGWNSANQEWAKALLTESDWYNDYGITFTSLSTTLSSGTASGLEIAGIIAENYLVPDNGGNNPVVYFSQSGGQPWSGVPFGGGNISSSGCSVTSLSMVLSYLKSGTDKTGWIYPSDVVQKIIEKTGNYNHFYAGEAGQGWGIFPAVAGYYGMKCKTISSSKITEELASGHPVIMSCKPSEFTNGGHFIVLTGVTDDGYIVVNDPNSSHRDKSSRKYTQSYLSSVGKQWWSFSE